MDSIRNMTEIGKWIDLVKYYVDSDNVVWCWNTSSRSLTNCGNIDTFRANFKARYRGELYPEI